MRLDNSSAEYEARCSDQLDLRDADRGDPGASSRGQRNHVQLRKAIVLPQVAGVHQLREDKR